MKNKPDSTNSTNSTKKENAYTKFKKFVRETYLNKKNRLKCYTS